MQTLYTVVNPIPSPVFKLYSILFHGFLIKHIFVFANSILNLGCRLWNRIKQAYEFCLHPAAISLFIIYIYGCACLSVSVCFKTFKGIIVLLIAKHSLLASLLCYSALSLPQMLLALSAERDIPGWWEPIHFFVESFG